jgi:ketosteroid isomerase-like protein
VGENRIAIAREIFGAVERRDVDGVIAHLDENVRWRPTAFLTGQSSYSGIGGVKQWLRDLGSLEESGSQVLTFTNEYEELPDGRVLVLGHGKILRDTGVIEQELGWIFEFEDDKVVTMDNYLTREQAREAAGVDAD